MTERRTSPRGADPGPAPTRDALHEAALTYLTRSASSGAMLERALERKVAAWARRAAKSSRDEGAVAADVAACREAIASIAARFREVGLLDDARFAEVRVERLSREGRSRRAISSYLAAKGVDAEAVRSALPVDPVVELRAALTFARKRRIGPFSRDTVTPAQKHKALAAMARAGFDFGTSERVLGMDPEEADERLHGKD